MKDYNGWNYKKKCLDSQTNYQHPQEKEIWWCSIGVNVGSEVYGKSMDYTRPILIINSEGSESCIGIPLSSKIKSRKYSCIIKTDDGKLHTVMVYQIRNFDKRRLVKKIYDLPITEYIKVQECFNKIWSNIIAETSVSAIGREAREETSQ